MAANKENDAVTVQEDPVMLGAAKYPLDMDAIYKKQIDMTDKIKAEYSAIFKQLSSKIDAAHLATFSKILQREEKRELQDVEELVEGLRRVFLKRLERTNFVNEGDVSNSLATLQVLKETFKSYEGTDWKATSMAPEQRLLPLRMRFKEKRLQNLEKQFEAQKKDLAELIIFNQKCRTKLKELSEERVLLMENIRKFTEHFKGKIPEMLNLQQDILDAFDVFQTR